MDEYDFIEEPDDEKWVFMEAGRLLKFVCEQVSNFSSIMLEKYVYSAMIEAARSGMVEFITEMLIFNPLLIEARETGKTMFVTTIENRREEVYGLIYCFKAKRDSLLSFSDPQGNNLLHLAAQLAPLTEFERDFGPAQLIQVEYQWYKEVWNMMKPHQRLGLNADSLKPIILFNKTHMELLCDGERAMKVLAQSCTVVAGLFISATFTAAFTFPGGYSSETGRPMFVYEYSFRLFLVSVSLSLLSAIVTVFAFLDITWSRYTAEDFYMILPRKMMIGLLALFISIITLLVACSLALALMIKNQVVYYCIIIFTLLLTWFLMPILRKTIITTYVTTYFVNKVLGIDYKEISPLGVPMVFYTSAKKDNSKMFLLKNIKNKSTGVGEKVSTIREVNLERDSRRLKRLVRRQPVEDEDMSLPCGDIV